MQNFNHSHTSSKYLQVTFYGFLLLALVDKIFMLINYGFKFTDDDQQVVCMAANDMLHGHFYQPCFYGQSYNPLIESLLGVPLLALKIPEYIALPIVTTILGMFPFFLFAFLFRKHYPLAALVCLALPAAMPWFYGDMVIMPRGFVTGIAIGSIPCAILLFGNRNIVNFILTGFISTIALTANPNSALFLVPILFYSWLINLKDWRFYVFIVSGLVLGSFFPLYIYYFYEAHPLYVVHGTGIIMPSIKLLKDGILHSDWYLQEISFIRSHAIIYILLTFLIVSGFLFLKRKYQQAATVIFAMVVFLLSFSIPKVHDGGDRINFPLSRMFLGMPFIFAIFSSWIENALKKDTIYRYFKMLFPLFMLLFTVIFTLSKYHNIKLRYPDEVRWSLTVILRPVKDLCETCDSLQYYVKKYNADLVVSNGYTKLYMYGCPTLGDKFETLYPPQERRAWDMEKEDKIVRNRILFMPKDTSFLKIAREIHLSIKKVSNNPLYYIIDMNGWHTLDLMRRLKLDVDIMRS